MFKKSFGNVSRRISNGTPMRHILGGKRCSCAMDREAGCRAAYMLMPSISICRALGGDLGRLKADLHTFLAEGDRCKFSFTQYRYLGSSKFCMDGNLENEKNWLKLGGSLFFSDALVVQAQGRVRTLNSVNILIYFRLRRILSTE